MRVGDLVDFFTKAWVFQHADARYKNPGIIIELASSKRYTVMWADGKITTEFKSYLQKNN
jgi:hypothetical protein|tara:strand:+ start:2237 stop:2416 length:180 start_codon:yes stop_codon:yes gene_type:complete